ncbi:hypothetical protein [Bacillus sp. EB600]|nr:hypothetical protein [Bacillus sp. EB600]MCQ6282395.1 hypothetical protein [Bacillus sp. EB600]
MMISDGTKAIEVEVKVQTVDDEIQFKWHRNHPNWNYLIVKIFSLAFGD